MLNLKGLDWKKKQGENLRDWLKKRGKGLKKKKELKLKD